VVWSRDCLKILLSAVMQRVARVCQRQLSYLSSMSAAMAAAVAYVFYPISDKTDIGHSCWKCGKYIPCTDRTAQGNDFELILTVKMETRHTTGILYGCEFLSICKSL